MSDSVRPQRRQPTRLPHPWESPGKNTGVGCHFLLQCMKVKSESEVAQSCPTLPRPHGLQPIRLLCPWDFPGTSTGVGCHCLLHQVALAVNKPPANAGDSRDADSIPRSGRSPEVRNGKPLQYSCLEIFMCRGAWQATVHGVAKSQI